MGASTSGYCCAVGLVRMCIGVAQGQAGRLLLDQQIQVREEKESTSFHIFPGLSKDLPFNS